jgi:hypothetical protein
MLTSRDVRGLQRVHALRTVADAHLAMRDWSMICALATTTMTTT